MAGPLPATIHLALTNRTFLRPDPHGVGAASRAEAAASGPQPNVFARYGAALLITGAAFGLTYALIPSLGNTMLVLFSGAVVISAWYGGRGPGIACATLSVLLADYFFIPPIGALLPASLDDLIPALMFVLMALVTSSLTGQLRSERQRAVDAAAAADEMARESRLASVELEAQTSRAQSIAGELEKTNELLKQSAGDAGAARDDAIASREKLKHTLDSITDRFTAYDTQWRTVYMNAAARAVAKAAGKDPDQLLGKVVWEEFPELVGTLFETEARRAVREGKPIELEEFAEPTDRWFRARVYPHVDGVSVYSLDITDQRKAETSLRASEDRYRALVSAMSDIAWLTDADGTVRDMPAWTKATGQTAEQLQGDGWLDAIHPDDRDRVSAAWQSALRRKAPYNVEYRLRKADGSYRWHAAHCVPVFDETGELMQWVGTINDIDGERRAVAEQQEESTLLEALNKLGTVLASELEPERIERTVARAATELTGAEFGTFSRSHTGTEPVRSDDTLADPRFGDAAPFTVGRSAEPPMRSYLAVPVISRTEEHLGGLVFGHSQPGAFTERHQRIAMSIASWASVAMDNARLYEAERVARAEAETANKAKSAFLATMSHELRTPLNAIGGYAELLEVGVHGDLTDMQQRDVSRIRRSQRNLLALINDILNFSKIQAGRVVYSSVPMVLSEHLAELESLIAAQLKEKRIEYDFRCGDAGCIAYADPEKVQQILLNLLSNAVKFTDSGGRISIECRSDGRAMKIQVSDTGVGIAPSKLETVFEPFIQLDRGTTTQHEGTGLGLAISRDLARGMGGDLTARSEPGKGSTFTLSLPTKPAS